jgi:hypothetical protein
MQRLALKVMARLLTDNDVSRLRVRFVCVAWCGASSDAGSANCLLLSAAARCLLHHLLLPAVLLLPASPAAPPLPPLLSPGAVHFNGQ